MTVRKRADSDPDAMPTFSPIFDEVSHRLGMSAASVYGVVWRHCQMREGICRASLRHMAHLLGCHETTVKRQLRRLIQSGYLKDTTPGLRNRPHVYRVYERTPVIPLRSERQDR
ncbi:MAG TPA: helix-turn-helix domain-containing protein [Anaerolineales bacterium]|nr:helix-turn-helix domain-containing protein [Anaerolineales bacterium]